MSRLSLVWKKQSFRPPSATGSLSLAGPRESNQRGWPLKIQPSLALSPAIKFFDRTSVSCRKTAVVLTAALRVYDVSGCSTVLEERGERSIEE